MNDPEFQRAFERVDKAVKNVEGRVQALRKVAATGAMDNSDPELAAADLCYHYASWP